MFYRILAKLIIYGLLAVAANLITPGFSILIVMFFLLDILTDNNENNNNGTF